MNCKTSEVAGAAQTKKNLDDGNFLTHSYDVATGNPLCKRVKADHLLCDPFATDENAAPTCPVCLKRDPRFAAPWGSLYGSPVTSTDGRKLELRRNGQRCRFYDGADQVGPEHRNVAPALAYAMAQGWRV